MKTRTKYALLALASLLIVSLVVCGGMVLPSQALSATITVTSTTDGITATHIGATEASSGFDTADMLDLGINSYRMWGSAAQTEPVDDDGVYGSPSIAEIKADPNIIPWSVWDANLHAVNWRVDSLYDQLLALKNADIDAVVSIINVNTKDEPTWMLQLNPPQTTEDWNEWWQHVFGMVYSINVRNDLDVHDWQILNEPDNITQGWGGTLADYIALTQYAADAIHYVYDNYLPGETPRIYAAQTVHANEWVQESIMYNDDIVDVYDWHNYGNNGTAEAEIVHGWMDLYDTDGVHEEFYLSEWGSYSEVYNDPPSARQFATYLIAQSQNTVGHIDGGAIFSMYRWTGGCMGLIEEDGSRTLTYYTLRNVIRGLQGGRQQYTTTGVPTKATAIAAVDEAADVFYLTIENIGGGTKDYTITLDVSAHMDSGTASVYMYKYETNVMDELVATPSVVNGQVVFDLLAQSLVSVVIPMGAPPPPTDTPIPPTDTPVPPTDTPGGPTDTPAPPPTDTPVPPPTDTPVAGANLALNQPTQVSSVEGSNVGANAVDGSLATMWRSDKGSPLPSEWIEVDLGSSNSISQVVLEWGNHYATTYTIQVSENGSDWSTVYSTSSGNGGNDTIDFGATSARYVKMNSTAWTNNRERCYVLELEVYQ